MILNKSNNRCRVKCVPGKTTRIRSKSGRCRKIKSITRKSRSRKSSTRKSRSRKSSPRKKLPKCTKEGQTRSRSSRRCRVPPCPPGKIRNKSTGGKCLTKCRPGRIRGPSGRCIKRPKKSEMSSDETEFTNSGTRDSEDLDDLIKIWDANDIMFPNSRGVIPQPGRRNQLDTPAWSVGSNNSGMGNSVSSISKQLEDKLKTARMTRYHLDPSYPPSSSSKPVSPAFARTSKQLEDKLKNRYRLNPNYFSSPPEQEAKFLSPRIRRRH